MLSNLVLGSTVSIFETDRVLYALEHAEGQGAEGQRRLYKKMLECGPTRFLSKPMSCEALEPVKAACPNFAGVLEDLSNYIELSAVGEGGLKIIPVLLAGDPGVGKTHFAKALSAALAIPYQFLSMGTMSAGWVLSGSAPTWNGARHGKVAEGLIESEFASQLYLVDEIDKTGGDSRYDPFGALLQLMEGETAKHFKDEFLDVELDASAILWVATANDVSQIPSYILSRMAVYEVPAPTSAQGRTIAANIYAALVQQHHWPFPTTLEDDVLTCLAGVPPRELKKKLLDGMASALRHKHAQLTPADIKSSHVKATKSMGFVPT